MTETPNARLPFILPSQAQKHVTHNSALQILDSIVQLSVLDRGLTVAPTSPSPGGRHIVGASATGVWAGRDDTVAVWQDGGWVFVEPREGWLAWVRDEQNLVVFAAGTWKVAPGTGLEQTLSTLGINASAGTTNRLALKSDASLFDHDGADHRLKLNKASAGDTASILFQTGYSGRAEFGNTGDPHWHVKVSADGTNWREGLLVRADNARVELPAAAGAGTRAIIAGRLLMTGGSMDPGDGTPSGVAIGYDTTNDYGFIGAIQTGVAQRPLSIQPLGGPIFFGNPTGTNLASAAGSSGFYHVSTANDARIDVSATNGSGFAAIYARNAAATAGRPLSLNRYGGGVAIHQTSVASGFALDVNGAIRCTSLTQTSDEALKTVLGPSLGLDFVRALNPVAFSWKDEECGDACAPRINQGLVAQDVARAAERLGVQFGGHRKTHCDDGSTQHMLDYSQFIAPLVRAVQELSDRIDQMANTPA